ncbi:MAG: TauD/TfdA family dioxygenase [Alphaproteobacteria bacterium]|nr:TauD/TfdA family dioxygenase [Alphaproteobacteria bacterium]
MNMSVKRISDTFVGEVDGVDLSDDHDAAEIAAIRQALLDHSILVFRDQTMTNAEHVRFSQKFGPSEIHSVKQYLLPEFPEIIALANRGEKGTKPVANGGAYWHSDITYKAKPPMASILYGLEVPPEGGDTLFCDMYAAYDALSDTMKARLDGMQAEHSYLERFMQMRARDHGFQKDAFELSDEQRAELAPATHPIVRTHPETGRKALFVNAGFTMRAIGVGADDEINLLDELNAHAGQDRFVYRHNWRAGDVVFWDNRCTMHRATDYDRSYSRRMHRTTVQGDVPF